MKEITLRTVCVVPNGVVITGSAASWKKALSSVKVPAESIVKVSAVLAEGEIR